MGKARNAIKAENRRLRRAQKTLSYRNAFLKRHANKLEWKLYKSETELRRLKNNVVTLENRHGIPVAQCFNDDMQERAYEYTARRLAAELTEEIVRCGALKIDKKYDRYHDVNILSARIKVLVGWEV